MNAVSTWYLDVTAIEETFLTHTIAYDSYEVAVAYLGPREWSYSYIGYIAHLINNVVDPLLTAIEIVET